MTRGRVPPLRTGGFAWGRERVALGLSLERLAELSGVPAPYLSLAENGRMVPTGAEHEAVMEALRKARADRDPKEILT